MVEETGGRGKEGECEGHGLVLQRVAVDERSLTTRESTCEFRNPAKELSGYVA